MSILDRLLGKSGAVVAHLEERCACEPLMARAIALIQAKRLADALVPLEQAVRVCPTNYKAMGNRGVCLLEMGKIQEADAALQQALKLNPNYAIAWENRGVCLSRQGRNDEALRCVMKAVEIDGKLPNAPVVAARILIDTKRFDEALRVLDAHLATNPRNWMALSKRALALHEKGDRIAAEVAYQRAMDANPTDHEGINNHGTLCEEEGRFAAAEQLYLMAASLKPDYVSAIKNLQRIRQQPVTKERLVALLRDAIVSAAADCGEITGGGVTDSAVLRQRAEAVGRDAMARYQKAIKEEGAKGSDLLKVFGFVFRCGVNDSAATARDPATSQLPDVPFDSLLNGGPPLDYIPEDQVEPVRSSQTPLKLCNVFGAWGARHEKHIQQTQVTYPELTRHALFWVYLVGATRAQSRSLAAPRPV